MAAAAGGFLDAVGLLVSRQSLGARILTATHQALQCSAVRGVREAGESSRTEGKTSRNLDRKGRLSMECSFASELCVDNLSKI
jgi:hypothetical protein